MSIFTSLLTAGTNSHTETSENANALATDFVSPGIVGSFSATSGAYLVTAQASPNMTVAVSSGICWVACTPSSQNSQTLRARNTASANVTIPANISGSTRYDFLYIQLDAAKAANPAVDASDVATLVTSRSSSSTTDNGTPPTYGLLLAVITVANGASSITSGNIADKRVASTVSSSASNPATAWNALGAAMTYAGNNGGKEFLATTSTDLSTTVSVGDKYSITRGTTAPTNCMAFVAASSQYATKASPVGMSTAWTAYTAEAWIYVNSYPGYQAIVGRSDSAATTGGWQLQLTNNGQVRAYYGTTTTFTDFVSYQSVPLKRWVHVAAVISSTASKTGAIYINGTLVPSSSPNTASTTLTQASLDLRVGTTAGTPAGNYFDGYMSEVRVWSAAQSQANIQANMAISLTGSETNLVALFQGNGNFNDKTANANNLTATNSAIATQAANPYNNIEYGIITKVTSTQLTIFCGTDYNIPNMALNSPQYSKARTPYGFPASRNKWLVDASFLATGPSTGSLAKGSWYKLTGSDIAIPTGDFELQHAATYVSLNGTAGSCVFKVQLDTATPTQNRINQVNMQTKVTTDANYPQNATSMTEAITNTAVTTYSLYGVVTNSAGTNSNVQVDGVPTIRAVCAYA